MQDRSIRSVRIPSFELFAALACRSFGTISMPAQAFNPEDIGV
jgi:hypothetical protein